MIGLVLHAETKAALLHQWEFALSHFRPDAIYCLGAGVPESRWLQKAGVVLIESADELPAEVPLVLLSPRNAMNVPGEVSLVEFEHPDSAIYWFGSDSRHLEAEVFGQRVPDAKVYIPTDSGDQMHGFTAWCVTAWDRRSKLG